MRDERLELVGPERILPFLKQMNLTVRFNRRIQLPTEGVLRYAQNPNAVFEKIKRDIDSSL